MKDVLVRLAEDHAHQRALCLRLFAIADSLDLDALAGEAPALLTILENDLPRHATLEETHLFPLLRRRCRPEDGIDHILDQLAAEHRMDEEIVSFLVTDLRPLAQGRRPANPTRLFLNARAFAETQRRHLEWEERIVLPLARKRLTPADLAAV